MQRVKLANLKLGDPDDVAIYAAAAVWTWLQSPEFHMIKAFEIEPEDMFWTHGTILSHSVTIDVWVDVPTETAVLLKLAGLTSLQ
jgi:hypothetical protein